MLRLWNMLLVILAFALSIFGTFLTRSGILSSVHSFTESPIGAWFLGFLTLVVVGSLALVVARLPLLRTRAKLESLVSREASFLYNNLLLVALTLTILWGVAYPILHEAVYGEQRVVGQGYYNFFLRVFGLPLLLLMGLGPLVAWRRASLRGLAATFAWPFGVAGSSAYDIVREGQLARGQSLEVGEYRLTYDRLEEREAANATEVRAVLEVERGGSSLGTVEAGKNAYTAEQQVSNEVGIRSDLVTGEDLFVIAEQVNPDGTVYLRVFVKPLVNLIWLAGFVFLLGALVALWPDAREQRRLALRYSRAGVAAES